MQIYTPKKNYKVLVRCFTYNQSEFITDALNGFAKQMTTFPFVCLIMDDCSIDDEQEVIKEWLKCECDMDNAEYVDLDLSTLILVSHAKNKNCFFAVYLLKKNLYGEVEKKINYITPWREHADYEAMCEGDDYWISNEKLQKQSDFLDLNKDVGLIRTEVHRFIQVEKKLEKNYFTCITKVKNKTSLRDIIMFGPFAAPCSWMYRTSLTNFPKLNKSFFFTGDLLMLLHFASNSRIVYFEVPTAVYRVLESSASHFHTQKEFCLFFKKLKNTRLIYAQSQDLWFRLKFWVYCCMICSLYHNRYSLKSLICSFFSAFQDFQKLFLCNEASAHS
ncbi:MAG: hypothetical protein MJZ73_05515 [Bacteroidaceae bacterium]|nr:hypothetical protein [Bacteroidaceae bacterium]